MRNNTGKHTQWRSILGDVSFFALKFWFPALIAAGVFPSLIAYSGVVFSALALWIVAGILAAGLIISLAHGYRMGSTHRYHTLATLVESQLGRVLGAFTAAASILSLLIAVSALVSTGVTFVVTLLELGDWWRYVLVIGGFGLLHLAMWKADLVRRLVPLVTLLIFLAACAVLIYGYLNYFSAGAHPGLWQLLSGSALAKNALTSSYFSAGWQAIAVAALLLVPVSPPLAMYRNETPNRPISSRSFHLLGASGAVFFALIVYLSFTVKGFEWMRLEAVVQGPGNLVLLLEVILAENSLFIFPLVVLLAVGSLVAAYIYLSSASVLLTELGRRNLWVHQVPLGWRERWRAATVVVFLLSALILAVFAHTRMDYVALSWVFFVAISTFLGQVARLKMWRQRFWSGDTFRQRHAARRNIQIAWLSVGISLGILVVVTLGFNSGWLLVGLGVWLGLGIVIVVMNQSYRVSTKKVAAIMRSSDSLQRSTALVLVSDFSASSTKTIRYAWAAHHPRVEVVMVVDDAESAVALRQVWTGLDLRVPLTLLEAQDSDHIGPVARFVQSLLDTDEATTISVYLPRQITGWRLFGFMYNSTQRAYAHRLGRMNRVTITWVGLRP